jgi:hypothetical protein
MSMVIRTPVSFSAFGAPYFPKRSFTPLFLLAAEDPVLPLNQRTCIIFKRLDANDKLLWILGHGKPRSSSGAPVSARVLFYSG